MAKTKTTEAEAVSKVLSPADKQKVLLINLLKAKTPGIFDREPNSGIHTGVEKLADDIISLLN